MATQKTPVSILQELMQEHNLIPHYQLLSERGIGTHKPTFIVRVFANNIIGMGQASSKKAAKHLAAQDVLEKMGAVNSKYPLPENIGSEVRVSPRIVHEEPKSSTTIVLNFAKNAIPDNIRKKSVAILEYYTLQFHLPYPVYEEVSACGPSHRPVFTYKCTVGSLCKEGLGRTKVQARDTAALLVFEALKETNFEITEDTDSHVPIKRRPTSSESSEESNESAAAKPTTSTNSNNDEPFRGLGRRNAAALRFFEGLKKTNFGITENTENTDTHPTPNENNEIGSEMQIEKATTSTNNDEPLRGLGRTNAALQFFEGLKKTNFGIIENTDTPHPTPDENTEIGSEMQTEKATTSTNKDEPLKKKSFYHFYVIKNYMIAKNITYEELWKDNVGDDFQILQIVLNTLGVKYDLTFEREGSMFIACLFVDIIPAFYLIALGEDEVNARLTIGANMLALLRIVTK